MNNNDIAYLIYKKTRRLAREHTELTSIIPFRLTLEDVQVPSIRLNTILAQELQRRMLE